MTSATAGSTALAQRVRAAIARRGWLPFDEFMALALYEPGLGYYASGRVHFGAGGDFVTAPELSALFGQCIATQCREILALTGGDLVEFGPGSGALACDVLADLAAHGVVPAHYWMVEISAALRDRQRARIAQLPEALRSRVHWVERAPRSAGVVIANEVADALPCKRFRFDGHTLFERGLVADEAVGWRLEDRAPSAGLAAALERLGAPWPTWPPGFESELCLGLEPWLGEAAASLERGALLVIDYGAGRPQLYHPQRSSGTLRCHRAQRAYDDALWAPGEQDITAWVDFTRVAEASEHAGLALAGYCTQMAFLLATGIEARLAAAREDERASLAARQLLLPSGMGEHFKVMALTRGLAEPLCGFTLQDLTHSL